MPNLNIIFTEEEIRMMQQKKANKTWHDFIIESIFKDEMLTPEQFIKTPTEAQKPEKPEPQLTQEQTKALQNYEKNFNKIMKKAQHVPLSKWLNTPLEPQLSANWQVYADLIQKGLSDDQIEKLLTPILEKPIITIRNRIQWIHLILKKIQEQKEGYSNKTAKKG